MIAASGNLPLKKEEKNPTGEDKDFEYSDKLSKYLFQKGGKEKVLSLLNELLTHINEVCEECERDRIRCALKPLCGKSRPFLTTRLEIGYVIEELPQFCLKQHLNYIKNFLKGKIKASVYKDVKMTISQFITIMNEIKPIPLFIPPGDQPEELIKVLFKAVKEIIPNATIFQGSPISYIYAYETLLGVDVDSRIVNLNPADDPVTSEEELKMLIKALCHIYNIQVDLIEEMYGFWYIDFYVKNLGSQRALIKQELELLRISRGKLEELSDYVTYTIREKEIHCLVDIASPGRNPKGKLLTTELIKNFFKIISEVKNKLQSVTEEQTMPPPV